MHAFGLARLGRDAEVRYTPEGKAVANLSLAFTYGRKGTDGKRPTQWVDASLWEKRAETLAPYLLKGGLVSVTLSDVCIQAFTKADGTPMTKLIGRVLEIELAGGGEQRAPAAAPTAAPQRQAAPAARPTPRAAPTSSTGFEDMDDDLEIPF